MCRVLMQDMDTIGSYKVVEVTSVLMKGNTMMVAG